MPVPPSLHGVESHPEVSAALASQLVRNRYLGRLRDVSLPDLTAIVDRVVKSFVQWSSDQSKGLVSCCNFIGNASCERSIPVVETAYALYVVRDGLLAILASGDSGARGEGCRKATTFFDLLVVRLLREY